MTDREEGLLCELRELNKKCRELEYQVDELNKRPECVVLETEQPGMNRIIGTRDFGTTPLSPGKRYKVVVHVGNRLWIFSTPMMLIETPDIVVQYADANTHLSDEMYVKALVNK